MNRIGVVTEVLSAIATPAAGELLLVDSLGVIVDATHVGPYAPPTVLQVLVGTAGGVRELGFINPNNFTWEALAYRAAVGKTVVCGYLASPASVYKTIDVTAAANINKFGTLTLTYHDLTKTNTPEWGNMWAEDVQIATGETAATYFAKLQAKAVKMVAAINLAFGATVVTYSTSGTAASQGLIQFAFAAGYDFTVSLDGTFDGTGVNTTVAPVFSGQLGSQIQEKELEAAILDGYNPVQNDKYRTFDTSKYVSAVAATGYDGIIIKTTSDKQYSSPGHPKGWDVLIELYTVNSSPGTIGTHGAEIVALLTKVKAASRGTLDMLTKAAGDVAYAPHS